MLELVCLRKSLQQWRTLKEVRLMAKQLRMFSFDDEGANELCCQTYLQCGLDLFGKLSSKIDDGGVLAHNKRV